MNILGAGWQARSQATLGDERGQNDVFQHRSVPGRHAQHAGFLELRGGGVRSRPIQFRGSGKGIFHCELEETVRDPLALEIVEVVEVGVIQRFLGETAY